jgi:hypothetical protein
MRIKIPIGPSSSPKNVMPATSAWSRAEPLIATRALIPATSFAERVIQLRLMKRLTQRQLAKVPRTLLIVPQKVCPENLSVERARRRGGCSLAACCARCKCGTKQLRLLVTWLPDSPYQPPVFAMLLVKIYLITGCRNPNFRVLWRAS